MKTGHILPATSSYNQILSLTLQKYKASPIISLKKLRGDWVNCDSISGAEKLKRIDVTTKTFNSWCKGRTLKTDLKISELCALLSTDQDQIKPYRLFFPSRDAAYTYEHHIIINLIEKARGLAITHIKEHDTKQHDLRECIKNNWGKRPIDIMQWDILSYVFKISKLYMPVFSYGNIKEHLASIEGVKYNVYTPPKNIIWSIDSLTKEIKSFWIAFLTMFDYPSQYKDIMSYLKFCVTTNHSEEVVHKIKALADENWNPLSSLLLDQSGISEEFDRRLNFYNSWDENTVFSLPKLEKKATGNLFWVIEYIGKRLLTWHYSTDRAEYTPMMSGYSGNAYSDNPLINDFLHTNVEICKKPRVSIFLNRPENTVLSD